MKTTWEEWYNGFLGSVTVLLKSGCSEQDLKLGVSKMDASIKEKVIWIMPSFLQLQFEIRMKYRVGQISRSLSTDMVIEADAAAFNMCCSGDVQALQLAFDKREVSPFAMDKYGHTLMDVGTARMTQRLGNNRF